MKEQVQAVINDIRPILQSDGGDIELIGVDEKPASLPWACAAAAAAARTRR